MNSTISIPQELTKLPFWEHLTPEECEYVTKNVIHLQYEPGQQIFNSDTQCLGVILVLKGTLRSYLLSPNGKEMTLYRTRAGQTYFLTANCVLDAISFDTQVDAEEYSEILLIPSAVYARLIKENIYVECTSYKLLISGYGDAVSSIERLVFLTLEQRLASFLLDESADISSDIIRMTHEQLASNIGSARVAVSRTLKSLEQQKLIELVRGGVRLLDKHAMYSMLD